MLYKETTVAYCRNYMTHTNTVYRCNAEFLVLNPVVHMVTTRL